MFHVEHLGSPHRRPPPVAYLRSSRLRRGIGARAQAREHAFVYVCVAVSLLVTRYEPRAAVPSAAAVALWPIRPGTSLSLLLLCSGSATGGAHNLLERLCEGPWEAAFAIQLSRATWPAE